MAHSHEPWHTEQRGETIYVTSGDKIILTMKEGVIYGGQIGDALRLVACVNACRGISDDWLKLVNDGHCQLNVSLKNKPLSMLYPLDAPHSVDTNNG